MSPPNQEREARRMAGQPVAQERGPRDLSVSIGGRMYRARDGLIEWSTATEYGLYGIWTPCETLNNDPLHVRVFAFLHSMDGIE